jgi:hypothetical protein
MTSEQANQIIEAIHYMNKSADWFHGIVVVLIIGIGFLIITMRK